jgi:uncharacterized protein RhaS with RHS repeats
MYYNARYYDAALGRFISADTLVADWYNPQLLNRFAYVRNNPVNLTDPTGHCDPDYCRWTHNDDDGWNLEYKEQDESKPRMPVEMKDEQNFDAKEFAADVLTISAITYDISAMVLDIVAGAAEIEMIGGIATGQPEIALPAGIVKQYLLVTTTIMSGYATAETAVADWLLGNTDLSQGKIGDNTVNSAINLVAGASVNSGLWNAVVSTHQVFGNDFQKLPTSLQILSGISVQFTGK